MPENAPGSALDRGPRIETRDRELAQEGVVQIYGEDIVLNVRGDARRFEWRASLVDLGPLVVLPSFVSGEPVLRGTPSSYLLTLPSEGGARAVSSSESADIAPGMGAAVFSPTRASEWRAAGEVQSLSMRIDPHFLKTELEALTGVTLHRSIEFALPMRTDGGAGAGVERLCLFLADELRRGSQMLEHLPVVTSLCESLVRALLLGQPHDHAHLLEKDAPPSSRTLVKLVEEYLDANAADPIRMADLTLLTGASGRSIEATFRAHRGSTPMAFLRRKRLERAQQLLLSEPDAPMMRVVLASGFLRPERFNAAYVRELGESPAATRKRGQIAIETARSPGEGRATGAARGERGSLAALSPREREVCERVARGMLNKQIAADLGISEATVKVHRARGMARLGVKSAAELGSLMERLRAG